MIPRDHALAELLDDAAGQPEAGPDLDRVERRAERLRWRRRTIRAMAAALSAVAALVIVNTVTVAPRMPPVDQTPQAIQVSLLEREADPTDAALERVDRDRQLLDPGSTRLAYQDHDHRYGVATAADGTQICLVRGLAAQPIGSISCTAWDRFQREGILTQVFTDPDDDATSGPLLAIVAPDGYTQLHVDGQIHNLNHNLAVLRAPASDTTARLHGPAGIRVVQLPAESSDSHRPPRTP